MNNSNLLSLGASLSAVNNCRNDVTGPAVVHMHRGCSRTLNPEKSGMRVAGAGVCTGIVVVRHDTIGLDLLAERNRTTASITCIYMRVCKRYFLVAGGYAACYCWPQAASFAVCFGMGVRRRTAHTKGEAFALYSALMMKHPLGKLRGRSWDHPHMSTPLCA
jgi:hypothetical protein